jgi:hypothetical protein
VYYLQSPSGAPESPPVFSGVHVTRSLVLYVCFVDRCLSFCTFSLPSTSVGRGNLNYIFGITTILWPVLSGIRVIRALIWCIMVCRSLFIPFVPFLVAIVLYVLRFTDSGYPFGFFKLFLSCLMASQHFPCGIKLSNNQQLLEKIIYTNMVQLKFGFGDFMFDKCQWGPCFSPDSTPIQKLIGCAIHKVLFDELLIGENNIGYPKIMCKGNASGTYMCHGVLYIFLIWSHTQIYCIAELH